MIDKTFSDYLYRNGLDPFEIAFKSEKELDNLKSKWMKENGNKSNEDTVIDDEVYTKLSSLNLKVDNNKLVQVVTKMTKGDDQTNLVGTWIYFCLIGKKDKAIKAKQKVSESYQKTITKYLDSFIQMLRK